MMLTNRLDSIQPVKYNKNIKINELSAQKMIHEIFNPSKRDYIMSSLFFKKLIKRSENYCPPFSWYQLCLAIYSKVPT